jgi:hypothetical protein
MLSSNLENIFWYLVLTFKHSIDISIGRVNVLMYIFICCMVLYFKFISEFSNLKYDYKNGNNLIHGSFLLFRVSTVPIYDLFIKIKR